jgi:hypothetical protein
MKSDIEKAVTSHNLSLIVSVLRQHGLARLRIEYAGSGDSGDTFEMTAYDASDAARDLPTVSVKGKSVSRQYGPAPAYAVTVQEVTPEAPVAFTTFLEDFHWGVLDMAGHSGFENGDGGQGSLAISVDGTCVLEHSDNYVATTDYTTNLSEFMPAPVIAPEPTPRAEPTLPPRTDATPYCVEV